jgi:transcriptional regulator with XRE-family HTH domain
VQRAIQELSPKLRAIASLRYRDGLSYEEIAEVLEISMGRWRTWDELRRVPRPRARLPRRYRTAFDRSRDWMPVCWQLRPASPVSRASVSLFWCSRKVRRERHASLPTRSHFWARKAPGPAAPPLLILVVSSRVGASSQSVCPIQKWRHAFGASARSSTSETTPDSREIGTHCNCK